MDVGEGKEAWVESALTYKGLAMAMAVKAAVYVTLVMGLAPLWSSHVRQATMPEVMWVASNDTGLIFVTLPSHHFVPS